MDSAHLKLRSKFQRAFFTSNPDNTLYTQEAPQTPPCITMSEDDVSCKVEVPTPQEAWSTPASQQGLTPTTMAGGFNFCMPMDQISQPSLDSSSVHQTPSETPSRPMSSHKEIQPPTTGEENFWAQKSYDGQFQHFHGAAAGQDMRMCQDFQGEEAIPILDLEHQEGYQNSYQMNFDDVAHSRRISGSSFTMSTSGALSDMQSYDDFSTALSDAPSFCSEYPPPSNRTSWMSSTHLSPVASPRMTAQGCRPDIARTQSRGRASPSPRPSIRSAPYSIETPRSAKRWSTGSYGTMSNRRPSPFVYHPGQEAHGAHQQPHAQPPFLMTCGPTVQSQRNSMLLPTQLPSQTLQSDARPYDAPAPLMSHGLFRMLQSNADAHSLHRRFAELSEPPDLFGALNEEQEAPPEEDMNPSDPDLTPREQDLRFEGDLYTPRWVRGHGNKREGWCGICKPGRWLVLKNSAYWYDKSFSHGISAATGSSFQQPLETRRMDGNPDVWEGLCGSCNEWIALVSSKKKGTTWFRHAYKCHSHAKAKDSAKRRRGSSNNRGLPAPAIHKMNRGDQAVTPHPTSSPITATQMPATTMPHVSCHPHHHHHHHALMPTQMPQALLANDPYPNMI